MAFYQGLTYQATREQRRTILRKAVLVTMLVLWFFTFLGDLILSTLQITVGYIRISGGVYMLAFSVNSALFGKEPEEDVDLGQEPKTRAGLPKRVADKIAVVPLAIPLLAGPGAIASVMILNQPLAGGIYCLEPGLCIYGVLATAIAVAIVSLATFILLSLSDTLVEKLSPSILFVLGKVMNILVGAIAISFIVQGIAQTFNLKL
jgi:MarC family membrane protein